MTTKKYGPRNRTLTQLINSELRDVRVRHELFLTTLQAYGVTSNDLVGVVKGVASPISNGLANELRDREKGIK